MNVRYQRIDWFLNEYGLNQDFVFEAIGMMLQFVCRGKISKEIWAKKVKAFFQKELLDFNSKPKTEQVQIGD